MRKDPRVNAKHLTLKNYLLVFLLMSVICTAVIAIFVKQTGTPYHRPVVILSMIGFVLFISGANCLLFALFRRQLLMKPVRKLSEAAQKVARGDFSLRIPPMRRDGRKDEFEVLFEDFNLMAEELGSTETLKTDFVANVSHEMKTPLAVIQNNAELLQADQIPDEKRQAYAACIKETAGRMTELVTNILRLNRLENQRILPELKRYDVCRQLAECILQFEDRWERKHIELDAALEDSAFVSADESLMELVWNNLMSNAVKFTPEGGTIAVRQRTEQGRVIVSFSDTGCGMDLDTARHIFDKFYQGDTSHATEGNGLGLALVQRVMTLMNGTVSVESEPGRGSTFTVVLPCAGASGRPG